MVDRHSPTSSGHYGEGYMVPSSAGDWVDYDDFLAIESQFENIQSELCHLLPGVQYMDPPDGGSVTPMVQVRRMVADLRQKLDAVVVENTILKSAFDKPQAYLSWHAIPPTWSDPGGGGEYLAVHDAAGHTNDDGTDCWPVYDKPEIEIPATDAMVNEIRAEGVELYADATIAIGKAENDEAIIYAGNQALLFANQLRADAAKGGSDD